MTAASSIAIKQPRIPWLVAAVTSRPLWTTLTLAVLITLSRLTGTVDSDVAWQLWIGQRILAGANLYHDIIETNPPLWFWIALPIDWLAGLLHLHPEPVLIVTMGCLVALSLAATDRLIGHVEPRRRTFLLCYGALALGAMPWMHVGQREQIALIGAIPYAALIASRREGRAVSPLLAALIGLGAALGFALKHYFLIVPAVLELWLATGLLRRWRGARPETIAMIVVGFAYATALVLLEPDFLTAIVPLIRLAYGSFGAPSLRYMFGPFALVGLILLAFTAAQTQLLTSRRTPFASALLIAALGFGAGYFVQFKGWPYHAIPLIGCASLALAAIFAESIEVPAALRVLAPALLSLPLAIAAEEQLHPALPSPDLNSAISGLQPGDSVGFLTTETAIPWSVTLQHRFRYASRYNGFWMMPAIMRNERLGNRDPRLADLGRRIAGETVADFRCFPPTRIIVSRPRPGEDSFDILPFFLRDREFAAVLKHYRVRSRTSLQTYELVSPLSAPATPCRHGV